MSIKIDSPITGYSVKSADDAPDASGESVQAGASGAQAIAPAVPAQAIKATKEPREAREPKEKAEVIQMHERLERPNSLIGSTYKIKTPLSDHALYVTINDIVLNPGTEHELRRPFEIFINSKNMEHFQWIVALTVIISAVFRKGGDVTFLVDELRQVFDPRGGYFKKGGRYMPSLVAEIGEAIDSHLRAIGLIQSDHLSPEQQALVDVARAKGGLGGSTQADNAGDSEPAVAAASTSLPGGGNDDAADFPADARFCSKCNDRAVIVMDGCSTCLSCGDSKCG